MDEYKERLAMQFGSFPEPVVFLGAGQLLYANEPGERLLREEEVEEDLLFALAEHPGETTELALGAGQYRVTVSALTEGDLIVLRPLPGEEKEESHPFSQSVFRMRECLSNAVSVQWMLKRRLRERGLEDDLARDLANQERLLYQMLRLTRQAELTQELDEKTFPREEGFDLAQVCEGMADETESLADLAGVRFAYSANVENLPFQGSKSLLTQMLLALVSNAVRAAGKEGHAEMKLHADRGRCVISLRDSGAGIPEDRLGTLFTGQSPDGIPRPGEGAGLGLYNAQRIATLHGGLLVVQSGQEGGTCVVVSLPIVTPPSVPVRNNPGYDNLGGFSPVRIELSDVLPWQAFDRKDGEDEA